MSDDRQRDPPAPTSPAAGSDGPSGVPRSKRRRRRRRRGGRPEGPGARSGASLGPAGRPGGAAGTDLGRPETPQGSQGGLPDRVSGAKPSRRLVSQGSPSGRPPSVASARSERAAIEDWPRLLSDEPLDPELVHEAVEVDWWDDTSEPVGVVDVKLSPLGTLVPCACQGMTLVAGDRVVVATARGLELGYVCRPSRYELRQGRDLPKVLRRVGAGDERQSRRNAERAQHAREYAERRIRELGLPMKLVTVEILHGGSRAVFYFESERRVDFRYLIRDLSEHLHLRVEMRQVGARDAAKIVGALGRCGQVVCCAQHLHTFSPVSIRLAKDQNLILSPEKVSGVCGRLLCCLAYEHEGYRVLKQGLPKVGSRISTPAGEGEVKDIEVLRRRVTVELPDGSRRTFTAEELGLPAPESIAAPAASAADNGPLPENDSRADGEVDPEGGSDQGEEPAAGDDDNLEATREVGQEHVPCRGVPAGRLALEAPHEGRRRRRRRRHTHAPTAPPAGVRLGNFAPGGAPTSVSPRDGAAAMMTTPAAPPHAADPPDEKESEDW